MVSTKLLMGLHLQAPANIAATGLGGTCFAGALGFLSGLYALLRIGLSGWLRPRQTSLVIVTLAGDVASLPTGMLIE